MTGVMWQCSRPYLPLAGPHDHTASTGSEPVGGTHKYASVWWSDNAQGNHTGERPFVLPGGLAIITLCLNASAKEFRSHMAVTTQPWTCQATCVIINRAGGSQYRHGDDTVASTYGGQVVVYT